MQIKMLVDQKDLDNNQSESWNYKIHYSTFEDNAKNARRLDHERKAKMGSQY